MSIEEIKPQELRMKLKKISTARVLAYFKKSRKYLSTACDYDTWCIASYTEEEAKIQNELKAEKYDIFKNELATRGHVD